MDAQSRKMIVSGIEPVDELMGGLESGQLYFVHGEASGKSVFGVKFLIEGLKQGENVAMVIRYSPEDAVRRFAKLGYDCLEDVYSGRLVILEYSDDIVQKIGGLRELTPVLRELEWLLGETRPKRLIFDPVTSVLAGAEGSLETRAREFAEWARSFGATVVLIANGSDREVIQSFEPQVAESFRFDVREAGDRAARFIAFEKSSAISDQAIEVDPSRGVFLLGGPYEPERAAAPKPPSIAELESIREELRSVRDRIHKEEFEPLLDIDLVGEPSSQTDLAAETAEALQTRKLSPVEERKVSSRQSGPAPEAEPIPIEELELSFDESPAPSTPAAPLAEEHFDELSNLIDDLSGTASPLDLDFPEPEPVSAQPGAPRSEDLEEPKSPSSDAEAGKPSPTPHGRAADFKIDSAMAARAAELLLCAPEAGAESPVLQTQTYDRRAQHPKPLGDAEVQAKDFNVLIIEDDAETRDLVTQTLAEYTVDVVHDGLSGLARLISFDPDLVVLDFDLPIIDGFKILTLIRSALNVPIIIVSGSRMRAIDRVMASELGADYYLTKPFSAKELKQKARQLIARYRGINSWIINLPGGSRAQSPARGSKPTTASVASEPEPFVPYTEFVAEVERRVKASMDDNASFSILGCRLQQMTAVGGRRALRLLEIVRGLTREADLTSTNPRNDLVVLLHDADTQGARAFAGRLRERVIEEMNEEPTLWIRSFPALEESSEATDPSTRSPGSTPNRRSSDQSTSAEDHGEPWPSAEERSSKKSSPRDSYIDLLEHL